MAQRRVSLVQMAEAAGGGSFQHFGDHDRGVFGQLRCAQSVEQLHLARTMSRTSMDPARRTPTKASGHQGGDPGSALRLGHSEQVAEFKWDNGGVYRGDVSGERAHGLGVRSGPSATTTGPPAWEYQWLFVYGQQEGVGVYLHEDGALYSGGWHEGTKHGHGIEEYPDGSRYAGNWTRGHRGAHGFYENHRLGNAVRCTWRKDQPDGFVVDRFRQGRAEPLCRKALDSP